MKSPFFRNAAGTGLSGAAVVIMFLLSACSGGLRGDELSRSLLGEADASARNQDFESATATALRAIESAVSPAARSEALSHLAAIDLMTWRDAQAWEHACEAEELSRSTGIDSLRALALLQKGKMKLFGAITEEDVKDDEALEYLQEALALSYGSPHLKADILLSIGQVYIGKNRFNNPPDKQLYARAGEYLDAGHELICSSGLDDMMLNSYTCRMRWYRQGEKWKEGIACCEEVLSYCAEDDYLHRSQAWNQLVVFYAGLDDLAASLQAHQQYVYNMEYYMQQKADRSLQEMESRYKASLKQAHIRLLHRWLFVLVAAIVLLVILVSQTIVYNRRLSAVNHGKEALLRFISRDLTSPSFNSKVVEAFHDMMSMDEASVRERCYELLGGSAEFGDEIADYVVRLSRERESASAQFSLTSREMDIVRLSREGLSAAQIADKLNISVFTVNNHRQNIYSKMGVKSNAEMLRLAEKSGLL